MTDKTTQTTHAPNAITQPAEMTPAVPVKKAELVVGDEIKGIVPRNIEELHRMAQGICMAGIVPDSYKGRTDQETISRVAIGIQKSLEVGLPPLTGMSNILIINNRPSIWGDAAVALVQSKGVVEWVKQTYEGNDGADNYTAVYQIKRKGQSAPYVGRFSIADAKRAKLFGKPGPWMAYPTRMLMNRARAFALRDGFADCLSGLAIVEEIRDITPPSTEPINTSFLNDEVYTGEPERKQVIDVEAEKVA